MCLVHLIIRNYNKGLDNSDDVKRFETFLFVEQIRRQPGQRMVIFFDMSDTGLRHLVSPIPHSNPSIPCIFRIMIWSNSSSMV